MAIILQSKLEAVNEGFSLNSGYVYLISAIDALGSVLFGLSVLARSDLGHDIETSVFTIIDIYYDWRKI